MRHRSNAIAMEAGRRANYSVDAHPGRGTRTLEQGLPGRTGRLSEQGVGREVIIVFEAHLLDDAEFNLPARDSPVRRESTPMPVSEYTGRRYGSGRGAARQATEHLLRARAPAGVAQSPGPQDLVSRPSHRAESLAAHPEGTPASSRRPCCTGTGPTEVGASPRADTGGGATNVTAVLRGQRPDGARARCAPLHELGRDVPGDISVVGFDDPGGGALSFWPPLTTIRPGPSAGSARQGHPAGCCGRWTATRASRKVTVPTRLIVRDSTAAPRR